MAKKKKHGDRVGSGRLMWAAGGGSRLWDREGLEWQDADKEVDRAEAERMLRSADVPVVISMGAGPLRWVDDVAERVAV